jgi:hypothetical protein
LAKQPWEESKVSEYLKNLIARARFVRMSPEEHEEQRQSFAYGNTHIENDMITRDTVARASEALRSHG